MQKNIDEAVANDIHDLVKHTYEDAKLTLQEWQRTPEGLFGGLSEGAGVEITRFPDGRIMAGWFYDTFHEKGNKYHIIFHSNHDQTGFIPSDGEFYRRMSKPSHVIMDRMLEILMYARCGGSFQEQAGSTMDVFMHKGAQPERAHSIISKMLTGHDIEFLDVTPEKKHSYQKGDSKKNIFGYLLHEDCHWEGDGYTRHAMPNPGAAGFGG
jgi:hypothetical protein